MYYQNNLNANRIIYSYTFPHNNNKDTFPISSQYYFRNDNVGYFTTHIRLPARQFFSGSLVQFWPNAVVLHAQI